MTRPGTSLFLGLDHHPDADREMFSPLRTGLDHLALQVTDRTDLDAWSRHLDALGVDHGDVVDTAEPRRTPCSASATRRHPHRAVLVRWLDMTQASTLPDRAGTRPHTSSELPHSQLDQQPADSRYVEDILTEALTWTSVQEAPSRISVDGARALTLESDAAAGPVEAFLVGQEFCHVHAQGDYSLHATLPLQLATAAERAGWAEPHYLVHTEQAPATVIMLYAPRDTVERDVILRLVRASYEFACTPSS